MNLIQNNPYRIVGLLAGATAKEQTKQISRLKKYIEAEQDPQDDFSFPALGNLNRTIESIEEAASKLDFDNDKINAAIFWFWNNNPITDEAAFEALKSGDIDVASDIWDKLITQTDEEGKRFWKPVTEKNYSAFHNYSILNLIQANGNLHNAIVASLRFLESELVHKFVSSVADETYKTSKKELQLLFLNQLHSEIDINKKSSLPKFLETLNKQEFVAKQDFMRGFVQKPIEQIEHKIETAKNKRKGSKGNAAEAGQELFTTTASDLTQLKSIVGVNDLKYTSIADKVANEILQCGIDYFKEYQDTDKNPSSQAMNLLKNAKSIAIGNLVKDRCDENIKQLQEWINDAPERAKHKTIKEDIENLVNILQTYENRAENINNSKELYSASQQYLQRIKAHLGASDDFYVKLSTKVASIALHGCVAEINAAQSLIELKFDQLSKLSAIMLLKSKVEDAWGLSINLGKMDLASDFRLHYNNNHSSLLNLKSQLANLNTGGNIRHGNQSSGGCYIATMAYGSYEHPQVLELREFRDEILAKTLAGRIFIKAYYFISPKLVMLLKNQKNVNILIRNVLNQFIKIIKQ